MARITIIIILFWLADIANAQTRTIHVLVALCDNKNQGIVPVPKAIGNGQDPANNLYWGCGYGVKTFLKKHADWKLVKQVANPEKNIYERLVFKHKDSSVYIIADAYDGGYMKQTVTDLFDFASGLRKQSITVDNIKLNIGGSANLIVFVGHDGLMDFTLPSYPTKSDNTKRDVMVMACASKNYFATPLKQTGAYPLIWTTHLMCPEAYTLTAGIEGWIKNESPSDVKERVAQAYNRYQKCGIKGARNLFATG